MISFQPNIDSCIFACTTVITACHETPLFIIDAEKNH